MTVTVLINEFVKHDKIASLSDTSKNLLDNRNMQLRQLDNSTIH